MKSTTVGAPVARRKSCSLVGVKYIWPEDLVASTNATAPWSGAARRWAAWTALATAPLKTASPDVRIQFHDLYNELITDEARNRLICEDVAQAVLFLVSPAAGWITGQTLVVSGGQEL